MQLCQPQGFYTIHYFFDLKHYAHVSFLKVTQHHDTCIHIIMENQKKTQNMSYNGT